MSDIVTEALARWVPDDHPGRRGQIGQDVKDLCAEITRLKEENERLKAALKKAGAGLNAGVVQYAVRDIHGNIVPGDEQYPWVKAMQIGLDAATAALTKEESKINVAEMDKTRWD